MTSPLGLFDMSNYELFELISKYTWEESQAFVHDVIEIEEDGRIERVTVWKIIEPQWKFQ
jgi:hypothetical protein